MDIVRSGHLKGAGYSTGKGGKREDLNGVYFRSRWEANWARYLNFLVKEGDIKSWKFEPKTFDFPIKRGCRFYTPDFEVVSKDGTVCYHEVKGYMDSKSATKLKRMKKYYPHVKIELIEHKTYKHISKQVSGFLQGWESAGSKHAY
jgi:hypothetical protein